MSRQHIQAYRRRLDKLKAASGSRNEGPLSAAFADLLDRWGGSQDLTLVPQWEGKGPRGNDIRVDGALVPSVLRIPFGYWEPRTRRTTCVRRLSPSSRPATPTTTSSTKIPSPQSFARTGGKSTKPRCKATTKRFSAS